MTDPCPFCHPETDHRQHIVYENELVLFLQKPQPILKGSGLIVPKKHRETVFDLTKEEWRATFDLLNKVKKRLDEQFRPDGYNIGWNAGTTAGQHILHAHLHVIPRFNDEPFAGRGIRSWLKSEENRRK
ncbi:HIT family protein [Bacillus marinisedimentorum]|uniref:HIT family protein n=1 Tax=Bacillus marinisedimentorum TaxID=1821260 RepID=UPI0007DFACB8|nr:HIT family protein [Bacillus marinisedimentorum]